MTRDPNTTDVPAPSPWRTGDEPPTHRQRAYLETLAQEAGEPLPDELTKAEAWQKIDELREDAGRDCRSLRCFSGSGRAGPGSRPGWRPGGSTPARVGWSGP